jgi:DNA recombination protein RmuC
MAFFYALPVALGLLCALPVALVLLCALLYVRLSKNKIAVAILTQDNNNFEKIRIELNQKIDDLFQEKSILQHKLEEYIERSGKSYAQIDSVNEKNSKLEEEISILRDSAKQIQHEIFYYQKTLELKSQAMQEIEKRMTDWESSRLEAINHAKAAIFEAGTKLTHQLLEQHKNETKESQTKISQTTSELQTQFEKILNSVAVLDNEIKASKQTVEIVKNSLLSPVGAGSLAEITLENILKASGLEPGRDFIMQYSLITDKDNAKLRPDAVVFLPANNAFIIDSKASKFFTELAQADSLESEQLIFIQLKTTMRNHLKSLTSKDYKEALRHHLKEHNIQHIASIMFLPSETAIEKLGKIDPDFMTKAWEQEVFPVGPTGLINILSHAKFQTSSYKQAENHHIIIEEIRKLLNSFATLSEYAKKVGGSLQNATNNYDKFAASFNSNLIPKAKNLEKLGIHLQKNKSLPSSLDRLTVISSNKMALIDIDDYDENELKSEL